MDESLREVAIQGLHRQDFIVSVSFPQLNDEVGLMHAEVHLTSSAYRIEVVPQKATKGRRLKDAYMMLGDLVAGFVIHTRLG